MTWRLAGSATLRPPFFRNATTDGAIRRHSSLAITTGSLPSITATLLLVVPKSIPIIFPIVLIFLFLSRFTGYIEIVNLCAVRCKCAKLTVRFFRVEATDLMLKQLIGMFQ